MSTKLSQLPILPHQSFLKMGFCQLSIVNMLEFREKQFMGYGKHFLRTSEFVLAHKNESKDCFSWLRTAAFLKQTKKFDTNNMGK